MDKRFMNGEAHTMYIDNIKFAMEAFDEALDMLARNRVRAGDLTLTVDDCPCMKGRDCQTTGLDSPFTGDLEKDVKSVIFNDPATIVTFADGSRVCVKTCSRDKFDKELGLVYAIIKRMYADGVDGNGFVKCTALGERLSRIVNGACDQKEVQRKAKEMRAAKKAAKIAAEMKAPGKAPGKVLDSQANEPNDDGKDGKKTSPRKKAAAKKD